MNFTKEYIKECDCPEIQELLDDLIEKGSYYLERNSGYVNLANHYTDNEGNIWLPTGDQLDEEIVKICEAKFKSPWYEIRHSGLGWDVVIEHYKNNMPVRIYDGNLNPLIAKIKLLKALLKEE
jgi:hypothetical protein